MIYVLSHQQARDRAAQSVKSAPEGYVVRITPPTRNLEQSARFHAICNDLANWCLLWAGKPRTAAQWKVLLISGHAQATRDGAEIVPGLEGEWCNLRESSAAMSKERMASLIEYSEAFAASQGVERDIR